MKLKIPHFRKMYNFQLNLADLILNFKLIRLTLHLILKIRKFLMIHTKLLELVDLYQWEYQQMIHEQ